MRILNEGCDRSPVSSSDRTFDVSACLTHDSKLLAALRLPKCSFKGNVCDRASLMVAWQEEIAPQRLEYDPLEYSQLLDTFSAFAHF
ncbi:hypothetical protein H6F74_18785 [Trichocoleus sp. FACHB-90]|uniref:hypothetical protein n=1 Tax=Cyanophyceae TaxID=3028117 RepID=UPI001684ABC1|nr:hypothetical protein [Trichocoleus sp. FACHB-90]MBD1928278.1 hypothetical protein [Trichocoleus sp. FACHB-90]